MVISHPIRDGKLFVNHGLFTEVGDRVVTYKHVRDGHILVAQGGVSVDHNGETQMKYAPSLINVDAGKHYELIALLPGTVLSCIHHLEEGEVVPPVMET